MKPSARDAAAADLDDETSRAVAQERWRRNSQDARPRARVSAYPANTGGGARRVTRAISASRDKFEIEPKNWQATARCREREKEVFEQFTQIELHDDDDDKHELLTETNYTLGESERNHHGQWQLDNASKLAPTKDNKKAKIDRERPATGVESSSGGGGGGGQTTTSGGRARDKTTAQQPKRGLLEALLGNRGKSWLEHKTVILDIQNGKRREQVAEDKNNNQTKDDDDEQQVDESRRETFTRLEESGDNDDDEDKSGRRNVNTLPTFGSVPQRLTRLPYFTYNQANGTTRRSADITKTNSVATNLVRQEGRYKLLASYNPRQQKQNAASGSVASLGSSAASTTSSGYSPTAVGGKLPAAAVGVRRASQLGYSNISNLFPGEPTSARHSPTATKLCQQTAQAATASQHIKSASVLDLRAEQRRDAGQTSDRLGAATPAGPQRVALSERRKSHFSALSPMTRRNSFTALQQQQQQQRQQQRQQTHTQRVGGHTHTRPHSQQSMTQRQEQSRQMATLRRQQSSAAAGAGKFGTARSRPLSATGGYLGGGHQRSPSASSAYRLGSAGMSPLVDPDCPVHGDSPEQPALGGGAGRRRTASDYQQRGQQPMYSTSQPDLQYGGGPRGVSAADRDDLYDPYNKPYYPIYDTAYQHLNGGKYHATPPQYSPVSPTRGGGGQDHHTHNQMSSSRYASYNRSPMENKQPPVNGGGGGGTNGQQAYYDGSSRFSLYYPAGGAAGGEPGQVRSSLAPPSDQLRRIIGYRPSPPGPRPVHLHPQWAYTRPFIHLKPAGSGFGRSPTPPLMVDPYDPMDGELIDQFMDAAAADDAPKFAPFNRLQDNQAIRAVDFHPSGEVYAIGSNSRALRICAYPAEHELRHFDPFDQARDQQHEGGQQSAQPPAKPPRVLFKFLQVHRGSIYCVQFNPSGQLLATGSNDQTVHIVKYNSITHNPDGEEFRLTMHNGTIRDLCFIDDSSGNGSSLLLSAGGGDNKVYVTDCDTITPFQSMAGHTQMVMALSHCGGAQFVSGSYDRTIRFWDLRSRSCTSIVSAPPSSPAQGHGQGGSAGLTTGPGAPVCALRVDPSGRLLASGHTDATCMLYDIRGAKIIQTFKPHDDEIRAISFSPKSYYLLTGGYDGRLVVSDLQGDLTQPLPSACVAESQDKIVQAKWHPADFTFVSTSADKSATLWSLPGEIRN